MHQAVKGSILFGQAYVRAIESAMEYRLSDIHYTDEYRTDRFCAENVLGTVSDWRLQNMNDVPDVLEQMCGCALSPFLGGE